MDVEGSDRKADERGQFAPRPVVASAGRPDSSPASTVPERIPATATIISTAGGWASDTRAAVELELDRGVAFLLAPVFLCVGAAVYFGMDSEPGWTPVLSLGAVLCLVAWFGRTREILRHGALALLLVLAGIGAGKIETWRAGTKIIGGEISTRLTGRVETIEWRDNGRVRLTLTVLATERPKLRYQPDRVRVTARAIPHGLAPGDAVAGVVRLAPPMGALRPGSYDFAFEAYFDRIGATGFFMGKVARVEGQGRAGVADRLSGWIEARRMQLAQRIRASVGGAEGEIAAALVAGVRAGIPEEVNETLRITGLAHVLSISGLHMALVAGVVIGTLRLGFAAFPGFASSHPVRKYAAAGALVALAAYLVISGSQVAAERAFLMIAVMLVALLFDRAALTMRNLAIAALAIVVLSPHEVVGPSFQMSFAATAALIAAYAWWAQRRAGRASVNPATRSRLAHASRIAVGYVLALAATSLIAGAATGIFGAWHFQRVSPLGLVANLAAMPIFSAIVMPAAVAGMALMPFGLDGVAFWAMGQGLSAALGLTAWLAARTPVDAIGAIPVATVVLMSLALVPLTLATTAPLRLIALPLILAGLATLGIRDLPHILLSEDARLVAVRTSEGKLAVNRTRAHAFTVEDWQRATMTFAIARPNEESSNGPPVPVPDSFTCAGGLCLIDAGEGRVVAHAPTMPAAERACGLARILIIADASAANPCPHHGVTVITGRRLALLGSAEIGFDGAGEPQIRHSVPDGRARPWHDHRRFSRAARGMPPYEPSKQKAGARPASESP